MSAKIIDGRAIALEIQQKISDQIKKLTSQQQRAPGLAVIIIGTDHASQIYVNKKREMCQKLGIKSYSYDLLETTSEKDLLALIDKLNKDIEVDGILVQLPLPTHIDSNKIIEYIDPKKDVDGFHPYNIGKLSLGYPIFSPCTPKGIMYLLKHTKTDLQGKNAIIIGSSNIVGKPMAMELINANCTVTICNNSTQNLPTLVKQADIVITATGVAELIKGDWIKNKAIVIDIGINRLNNGKIVGDVEFKKAKEKASWITPVPGGVGPITVTILMENTLISRIKRAD